MYKLIFCLGMGICSLWLSSCSKNNDDSASEVEGPKFKAAKAVLTHPAKCGLCHVGNDSTLNFSVNKTMTSNTYKIAFSLQFGTMPPPPSEGGFILTTMDKNAILTWINNGGNISD